MVGRQNFKRIIIMLLSILVVMTHVVTGTETKLTEKELNFLKWAKEKGCKFEDYLEWPFDFLQTGRGVRAKKDILPSITFLSLPFEMILNSKNALRVDQARLNQIQRFYPHRMEALFTTRVRSFDRMVLVMMMERYNGKKSFWYPYIEILPEKNEDGLAEWSEDELQELQNDQIVEALEVFIQERHACWETIQRLIFDLKLEFLRNETLFQWAFFVIASRSFQLTDDMDEFNMIPVADLLNHHSMSSVAWKLNPYTNKFEMKHVGVHKVQQGQEVFNHYGDLTTDRTLLDYSFILEENYLEEVTVEMPLDLSDLELKRDLWDGSELDLDHFTNIKHLLQFCRIVTASDLSQDEHFYAKPSPSLQNEIHALEGCRTIIFNQLPGTTSLEYDMYLLNQPNLPHRLKMAIKYRVTRKKLFHRYANFCSKAIDEYLLCVPYGLVVKKPLGFYFKQLQRLSRKSLRDDAFMPST